MARETGRVRTVPMARRAELEELRTQITEAFEDVINRFTVIEAALASSLDGLADVQEALGMLDEEPELEGDEDAQDDSSPYEGDGPKAVPDSEEDAEDPQ